MVIFHGYVSHNQMVTLRPGWWPDWHWSPDHADLGSIPDSAAQQRWLNWHNRCRTHQWKAVHLNALAFMVFLFETHGVLKNQKTASHALDLNADRGRSWPQQLLTMASCDVSPKAKAQKASDAAGWLGVKTTMKSDHFTCDLSLSIHKYI